MKERMLVGLIILGSVLFTFGFVCLANYLQEYDRQECAAHGYGAHTLPGRTVRLGCIDDQNRLVFIR